MPFNDLMVTVGLRTSELADWHDIAGYPWEMVGTCSQRQIEILTAADQRWPRSLLRWYGMDECAWKRDYAFGRRDWRARFDIKHTHAPATIIVSRDPVAFETVEQRTLDRSRKCLVPTCVAWGLPAISPALTVAILKRLPPSYCVSSEVGLHVIW